MQRKLLDGRIEAANWSIFAGSLRFPGENCRFFAEFGSGGNKRKFLHDCFYYTFSAGVIDVIGRYFASITLELITTDCFT